MQMLDTWSTDQQTECFFLNQCVRQANDEGFRDLLLRLRDEENTPADYDMLSQRFQCFVDPHDATRLFPKSTSVQEYNSININQLNAPIAIFDSAHNSDQTRLADSHTACGVERNLSVSEGSKVMLKANLWVEKDLVNGMMGNCSSYCVW